MERPAWAPPGIDISVPSVSRMYDFYLGGSHNFEVDREAARKRGEKSMGARLGAELLEASEGRGGAMKRREEVHRMAEANKAFAHYRF